MSLAFENSSQFRELAEVNGSSIIAEIAGKLAASLLEVAMAAKVSDFIWDYTWV